MFSFSLLRWAASYRLDTSGLLLPYWVFLLLPKVGALLSIRSQDLPQAINLYLPVELCIWEGAFKDLLAR